MTTYRKKRNKFKEILIVVSGLNPQVLTETLYYLTQIKKPESRISEIYAITTDLPPLFVPPLKLEFMSIQAVVT